MLHVFIINVNAGKNNSILLNNIINNYCANLGINYKIEYVYEKEDTKKITEIYKKFDDVTFYSVGGDGTLNQIINCIVGTNIKLCVIPAGTGNDFYKSLNEYKGNKIDLGKVNDKYFINVASFGLDAEIANTANIIKNKKVIKNLSYPIGIIKNFFPYKAIETNINNEEKLITILTICNACYYGGGFHIAPEANINDGLFDIYEVGKLSKLETLKLLLKLLKAEHTNDKNVNFYRTNKLTITSDYNLKCNLDGEIIVGDSFNFSIEKDAIVLSNDELKIKELLKYKKIIK